MGWGPDSASEKHSTKSHMSSLSSSLALSLEFRAYQRRFKSPLKTAHGEWSERTGAIVRLEAPNGAVGYGEVAPVPWFGDEPADPGAPMRELDALAELGGAFQLSQMEDIALPALRWALECAYSQMMDPALPGVRVPISGLLPAGEAVLAAMPKQFAQARRAYKWKIGVLPAQEEIALAEQIANALPKGVRLRLDANGGLSADDFADWLTWCQERRDSIDYLEQPLPPGEEAEMFARAEPIGVPIALDESVTGVERLADVAMHYSQAVLIVKPSLLGSRAAYMRWRAANGHRRVVYSSCFETAVGLKAVWELAALDWPPLSPAGLDTVDLMEDDGLCPIRLSWELTKTDWETGIEERVWQAL